MKHIGTLRKWMNAGVIRDPETGDALRTPDGSEAVRLVCPVCFRGFSFVREGCGEPNYCPNCGTRLVGSVPIAEVEA